MKQRDTENVMNDRLRHSIVHAVGCAIVICVCRQAGAQSPAQGDSAGEGVAPQPHQIAPPSPEPSPSQPSRYVADPITDGAVLSLSLGMALLSEMILATGEITPQQPQLDTELFPIDRGVITARPIAKWRTASTLGLSAALVYAAVDPVLSGYRDGFETGLVDAIVYAEAISVTWAVTNLSKIAFRRPRPSAYQEARRNSSGSTAAPGELSDTASAMSFFSGHASITAAVSGTATYLAFSRSEARLRPWLTLGIGTAVTTLVSIGRVRSGAHFPTDVIAGAMVGAGIGVLVPHTHRERPSKGRPLWIGFGVEPGGAFIQAHGLL